MQVLCLSTRAVMLALSAYVPLFVIYLEILSPARPSVVFRYAPHSHFFSSLRESAQWMQREEKERGDLPLAPRDHVAS